MVEETQKDIQIIYSTNGAAPHPSELRIGGIAISFMDAEIYSKNELGEVVSLSLSKYVKNLIEMNEYFKLEFLLQSEKNAKFEKMLLSQARDIEALKLEISNK